MEIWKDIEGYEGLYQISNMGNVKSFHRGKERILKPRKDSKNYLKVTLCKDNKQKDYKVHRLVAEVFISKIDEKYCVDHVNGIRDDNRAENLRWCTQKENCNFGLSRKHRSEAKQGEKNYMYGKTGALHHNSKQVLCIELNKIFGSIAEVERELGINSSNISQCCKGKYKSAGKHPITGEKLHWKYM